MVCPHLGGVECRGHAQCPALAPSSSEVAVVFLTFLYLLSIICLNCTHVQLFLVYSFFVFYRSRRRSSGYKLCSQGPQVPSPSLSWGGPKDGSMSPRASLRRSTKQPQSSQIPQGGPSCEKSV